LNGEEEGIFKYPELTSVSFRRNKIIGSFSSGILELKIEV
jgi:hypothetical protein